MGCKDHHQRPFQIDGQNWRQARHGQYFGEQEGNEVGTIRDHSPDRNTAGWGKAGEAGTQRWEEQPAIATVPGHQIKHVVTSRERART